MRLNLNTVEMRCLRYKCLFHQYFKSNISTQKEQLNNFKKTKTNNNENKPFYNFQEEHQFFRKLPDTVCLLQQFGINAMKCVTTYLLPSCFDSLSLSPSSIKVALIYLYLSDPANSQYLYESRSFEIKPQLYGP